MQSFLLVFQVLVSIALITMILLQHGKGADAGAAFGSVESSTVFGSAGSASFLSRLTAVLATIFFAVSLTLTVLAHRQTEEKGLMDKYKQTAPAVEQTTQPADVPAPVVNNNSDVPAPVGSQGASDVPAPVVSETPAQQEAPDQDAKPGGQ